jgi:hypothetical protein
MKRPDKECQEKLRKFFIKRSWLHEGKNSVIPEDMYESLKARKTLLLAQEHWAYLEGFVDGWESLRYK